MHLLQLREQLKHEDLVHLLYGIARNSSYSVTTRVNIDRANGTVNEERNEKTPANAPAVKGGASWYPRAARGRPA